MTSTTNRTSRSHPGPTSTVTTSMTSRSTVSAHFMQRPNVETETPEERASNKIMKDIKDFHRTLTAAITVVTNTTNRSNHKEQVQINNKTTRYPPGT